MRYAIPRPFIHMYIHRYCNKERALVESTAKLPVRWTVLFGFDYRLYGWPQTLRSHIACIYGYAGPCGINGVNVTKRVYAYWSSTSRISTIIQYNRNAAFSSLLLWDSSCKRTVLISAILPLKGCFTLLKWKYQMCSEDIDLRGLCIVQWDFSLKFTITWFMMRHVRWRGWEYRSCLGKSILFILNGIRTLRDLLSTPPRNRSVFPTLNFAIPKPAVTYLYNLRELRLFNFAVLDNTYCIMIPITNCNNFTLRPIEFCPRLYAHPGKRLISNDWLILLSFEKFLSDIFNPLNTYNSSKKIFR